MVDEEGRDQYGHERTGDLNELLDHAQKANMRMLDAPFELYIIDNRDTSDESEFLTELRVRVEVPVNTTGEA